MVVSIEVQDTSSNHSSSKTLEHAPPTYPQRSRFLDLPVNLRAKILNLAISSPNDYWLDRRVFCLDKSVLSPSRKRVWSFAAVPGAINLLCVNKQIRREVQEILFTNFAFFAFRWDVVIGWLLFPGQLEFFPLQQIRHLVYMTQVPRQLKHEEKTVSRLLSSLPKLESVRVLVTFATIIFAIDQHNPDACSDYIVDVALLFRHVGQVSVIGQDLVDPRERLIVFNARRRLREMGQSWYRELYSNYPACHNGVLLTREQQATVSSWYYPAFDLYYSQH